ncbi:vacuolar protein sorting-associated protein 13 family protein, partial [Reticulomyxa filosa]
MDVSLQAPKIRLRQDVSKKNSLALIIDLGKLSVKSNLNKSQAALIETKQESKATIESTSSTDPSLVVDVFKDPSSLTDYYDLYVITVEGVKIYIDQDTEATRILQPLDLTLNLWSCIFPTQPKYPTVVCTGELPQVNLRVSALNIRKAMLLIDSLLAVVIDEMETLEKEKARRTETNKKNAQEPKVNPALKSHHNMSVAQSKVAIKKQMERELFNEKTQSQLLHKVNFLLRFTINTVGFQLVDDTHDKPQLLLQGHIDYTELGIEMRKWDQTISFFIEQMAIEDCICPKLGTEGSLYLLMTKGFRPQNAKASKPLDHEKSYFRITLKTIDSDSPQYKKVDQIIDIYAGSLYFFVRPETVYGMAELLFKNLFPAATEEDRKQARHLGTPLMTEAKMDVDHEDEMVKKREERLKKMLQSQQDELSKIEKQSLERKAVVNIRLLVTLQSIEVVLCAEQYFLGHAGIEGLTANVD